MAGRSKVANGMTNYRPRILWISAKEGKIYLLIMVFKVCSGCP